jgi:hypothetical protein
MQRKATKTTRGPNAEEQRFQAFCKESDCSVCGNPGPSIVHHCEGSTFKHNKVLVGHWFTIPLCETCDDVITKGSRRAFREKFGPQSHIWNGVMVDYQCEKENFLIIPLEVHQAIMDWGR